MSLLIHPQILKYWFVMLALQKRKKYVNGADTTGLALAAPWLQSCTGSAEVAMEMFLHPLFWPGWSNYRSDNAPVFLNFSQETHCTLYENNHFFMFIKNRYNKANILYGTYVKKKKSRYLKIFLFWLLLLFKEHLSWLNKAGFEPAAIRVAVTCTFFQNFKFSCTVCSF